MEIHTLHEFMLHTKTITYGLIILILLGMLGFWTFLTGKDDDHEADQHPEKHGH